MYTVGAVPPPPNLVNPVNAEPAIVCAELTAGSASVPRSVHRLTHAVFSGEAPAPVSDALILIVPPALKK